MVIVLTWIPLACEVKNNPFPCSLDDVCEFKIAVTFNMAATWYVKLYLHPTGEDTFFWFRHRLRRRRLIPCEHENF